MRWLECAGPRPRVMQRCGLKQPIRRRTQEVDHPHASLPPVIASGRYSTKPQNDQSIQKRFPSVLAMHAVSAEKTPKPKPRHSIQKRSPSVPGRSRVRWERQKRIPTSVPTSACPAARRPVGAVEEWDARGNCRLDSPSCRDKPRPPEYPVHGISKAARNVSRQCRVALASGRKDIEPHAEMPFIKAWPCSVPPTTRVC